MADDILWREVAPILRDTWAGEAKAQAWVRRHARWLERRLERLARREARGLDAEELAADALGDLWEKVVRQEGLRPHGATPPEGSAVAFLSTVLHNLVRDAARRRHRKLDTAPRVELDAPAQDGAKAVPAPLRVVQDEGEADRDHHRQRIDAAFAHPSVQPNHLLAFLLIESPPLVERPLVDRAAARSKGDAGLSRDAPETWTEVERWREPLTVSIDLDHRGVVGWMLRSRHSGPWAVWAETEPGPAKKARDTIQKWKGRAAEKLAEVLRADGGRP